MATQKFINEKSKKAEAKAKVKNEKTENFFFRFATIIKCDGSPSTLLKKKKREKTRVQFETHIVQIKSVFS